MVVIVSAFAVSTDTLYAKKNKDKTVVSENTVADTEDAAAGSDAAHDVSGNETVSGDAVGEDAVSDNTVYTKKQKKWLDRVMADTDEYVPVFAKADAESGVVGRMYKNSVAKVIKVGKKFTKVKSGKVKGYIANSSCIYGLDALDHKKALKKEDKGLKLCGIRTPLIEYTEEEEKLLAAIIYCESGYEIYEGQVAVGAVVMNRMQSSKFPDTIEEVIYQRYQFGPASSGLLEKTLQGDIKESCIQAAQDALYDVDPTNGSFYFRRVGYTEGIEIGNHVFF